MCRTKGRGAGETTADYKEHKKEKIENSIGNKITPVSTGGMS